MGKPLFQMATTEEVGLCRFALRQLESQRLVVKLAPAPDPRFDGHMIRVVECKNPEWYRAFHWSFRWRVKRDRVEAALRRVVERRRIRFNGYEVLLVKLFKELRREYASRHAREVGKA